MSAQGRLEKAKWQMEKLRALHPRISEDVLARREFIYIAEDCLVTLRSVPDHRLQEASDKYGLGIDFTVRLFERTYRKKATNNHSALGYVDWQVTEQKQIETTSTYGLPLGRRDLAVHRTETHLNPVFKVVLHSTAPPEPPYWSFSEIPYRDALQVLEELLARMERFVRDSDARL